MAEEEKITNYYVPAFKDVQLCSHYSSPGEKRLFVVADILPTDKIQLIEVKHYQNGERRHVITLTETEWKKLLTQKLLVPCVPVVL